MNSKNNSYLKNTVSVAMMKDDCFDNKGFSLVEIE